MKAPVAKRIPTQKTVHGVTLKDDYAWLREKMDPAVTAYLEAENAYTEHCMAHTKDLQEKLYKEMLGRIKEDDRSVPYRKGNYWYYTRTEEGKAYAIHCRKKGNLEAQEEIILDENALAEGHEFFDLGDLEISTNEELMAYTVDYKGAEKYALQVKNLQTGELHVDQVVDIYEDIEWANDNATLYYVRLEEGTQRPYKLFRHTLGQTGEDPLVFHEPDDSFFLSVSKARDDQYLFIDLNSMITSEVHAVDANDPQATPRCFAKRSHGIEYSISHHEGWFYIVTNKDALNFRLLRCPVPEGTISLDDPSLETVIAHSPEEKIDYVEAYRDHLVVYGRKNGLKNIQVRNLRNGAVHDIEMPESVYTVSGVSLPEYHTQTLRFNYASLTTPASVYDYEMEARTRELRKQQEIVGGYDSSQYESQRIFATSHDGAKVPVSLVYRKDLRKDGPQPTLLYAYGSYGHSIEPYFSSSRLSLLDRGMVFAIAHIRGGGEMGRQWYETGKFLFKRNTFLDFIAAAEHLVAAGFTSAAELAIAGGSAGGMLMGTVTNMRPDLFRVVQSHVPFVDVMNTMLDPSIPLTVIEYDEWGNPNDEQYFHYMLSYSPYDNLEPKAYPDMLVTAGLNDPRVHYWEPAKYTARLRQLKTDGNILLLKTNMGAGHQGASGRYGHLKELAFEYAFLLDRLGLAAE